LWLWLERGGCAMMGSQSSFELARVDEEANLLELMNRKTKIAMATHKSYCGTVQDNFSSLTVKAHKSKPQAAQVSQTPDWKSTILATSHERIVSTKQITLSPKIFFSF
jgi:hypothetical protein